MSGLSISFIAWQLVYDSVSLCKVSSIYTCWCSINILIELMSKLRAGNDWIIGMCVAF